MSSFSLNFCAPGWRRQNTVSGTEIYVAGYFEGRSSDSVADFLGSHSADEILQFCRSLRGEFGLYFSNSDICLGVTDHICSFPISYTLQHGELVFFSNDIYLYENSSLKLCPTNLVVFQSAGYTIGTDTLYKNAHRIESGTCVYARKQGSSHPQVNFLNTCNSFPAYSGRRPVAAKDMLDATVSVFQKSLQGCCKRSIAIPLSAGFDSRLILSLAKLVGQEHIITYSYGSRGNYEASVAEKLARRLGVVWHFIETNPSIIFNYTKTKSFYDYRRMVSDGISIPIYHDLYVTEYLKTHSIIDHSCIMINGNSGDYISGGHIPRVLLDSEEISIDKIAHLFLEKHFNLWPGYDNEKNTQIVFQKLIKDIHRLKSNFSGDNIYIWERLEFENRQIKNVVKRQKIYDWFNLEWRLPLWHLDYINFWAEVSLDQKTDQSFYQLSLKKKDYFSVWSDMPFNEGRFVSPRIFRWFIRPVFKIVIGGIFGKNVWKKFESRFLVYFTDDLGLQGIYRYLDIIRFRRFRNYISLHCKDYIYWRFGLQIGSVRNEEDI